MYNVQHVLKRRRDTIKKFGISYLCGCRLLGDGSFASQQSQPTSNRGENLFVIFWRFFFASPESWEPKFWRNFCTAGTPVDYANYIPRRLTGNAPENKSNQGNRLLKHDFSGGFMEGNSSPFLVGNRIGRKTWEIRERPVLFRLNPLLYKCVGCLSVG